MDRRGLRLGRAGQPMAPGLRHLVFELPAPLRGAGIFDIAPRQLFVDQAAGDVFGQESREGAAGGRARRLACRRDAQ